METNVKTIERIQEEKEQLLRVIKSLEMRIEELDKQQIKIWRKKGIIGGEKTNIQ
jgi:cell division septum initiation protein DivIVA